MSFYQLGDKALKVSMQLFAVNRKSLVERLRKVPDLPKSAIVILEGGKTETRHCTDHEHLFRQVILFLAFFFLSIKLDFKNTILIYRSRIFIGVSVWSNPSSSVPSKSRRDVRSYLRHVCLPLMVSGWESKRNYLTRHLIIQF